MSLILKNTLSNFARLKPLQPCSAANIHTASNPVCVHATKILCGAPVKRKTDIKARQYELNMKKLKKLNKELKQQMRNERIKKPIEEMEVRTWLLDSIKSGLRVRKPEQYTEEQKEAQILMMKEWASYCMRQHRREMRAVKNLNISQQRALDELREESEELYQQAIQIDTNLLNYSFKGPVHTPVIEGYETGDGVYIDETNYFEKQGTFTQPKLPTRKTR